MDATEEEKKAEKEIAEAIKASEAVSPDETVDGLGPSKGVMYVRFRPSPKKQYDTELRSGEKPPLLTYFAIQGLGEVPRLMLAEAGMPYDHAIVVGGEDQSVALNWRSRSPIGLLPTLSGLGIPRSAPICQSGSVIRLLARRLGMGGDDFRADVLYETAKDLNEKKDIITSVDPEKDYSVHKGAFSLGRRVECMLRDMPDPKDGGAALNYGQVQLFHVLKSCETNRGSCVKENLGEVLDAFRLDMEKRAGLSEYLNGGARFPRTNGEMGREGGYTYHSGPLRRGDVKYA